MNGTIDIAVIITCFNRKEKTVSCLKHLYAARDSFNSHCKDNIRLSAFITDDGCTDGTADEIIRIFGNEDITISHSNGNLFWAKGMCLSWEKAMAFDRAWDFYLLLNDDTDVYDNCFELLLEAHSQCISQNIEGGIYSGITCDRNDTSIITYGGRVWTNYILGKDRILLPTGSPQRCDKANSNIMLVSNSVVERIGIFYNKFKHGVADYDYSMRAVRKNIPVLVTSSICGKCNYDHRSDKEEQNKILSMTLSERKNYFDNPLHSSDDILLLKKRNTPLRYPLGWLGRFLNLYCPHFYYALSDLRKK